MIAGKPRPIRIGRGMAPAWKSNWLEIIPQPTLAVGGHMKASHCARLGPARCRLAAYRRAGQPAQPRCVRAGDCRSASALSRRQLAGSSAMRIRTMASARWAVGAGISCHACPASRGACLGTGRGTSRNRALAGLRWDGVGFGERWRSVGWRSACRRAGCVAPRREHAPIRSPRRRSCRPRALAIRCGVDVGNGPRLVASDSLNGRLALQAWRKRIGTARTSSVGRLFDAAASLVLGIEIASYRRPGTDDAGKHRNGYDRGHWATAHPRLGGILRIDWEPLLPMLYDGTLSPPERASIFHESLAQEAAKQAIALLQDRMC